MAGQRNMVAQFILRLRDLVSAPLGVLQRRLQGLRDTASRIGAVGAIIAGISFAAPIAQAAAFDQRLRDIAVTAGQAGPAAQEMIDRLGASFDRLALETAQTGAQVTDAAGVLISAGMDTALIERLLPTIARVATATNASITDIASTAFTLSDTLSVPADQMEGALAAMVVAGQEGRFELRAMAREFPALTAAAAGLGMTGRNAVNSLSAALQVARKGAGSESEAANNLSGFLNSLASPDVVRNFRDQFVDLPEVVADAVRRNINPIEAVVSEVRRLTGGDGFRLTRLFGDREARNFLRPMIQQTNEYLRIRDVAARADPSIINTQYRTQMEGLTRQLVRFNELLSQMGTRVGIAFGRIQVAAIPALERLHEGIAWMDANFPGSIDTLLTFTGGAIGLTATLGFLGVAAKGVGLGLAAVSGPVGWAAAAIVAAAVLIWTNWDSVRSLINDFVAGFQRRMAAATAEGGHFAELARIVRSAWAGLAEFFGGLFDTIGTRFRQLMTLIQPIIDAADRLFGARPQTPEAPAAPAQVGRGTLRGSGAAQGYYADPVLPTQQRVGGEIVVRAAPGTEVTRTTSENRDVPITTAPDRGPMLSRP